MGKRKQHKGKGKFKTRQKLCTSLLFMLFLSMLWALVFLGVKQRCPELGLRNCLYSTMLTFGARKLERALLSGNSRLPRLAWEKMDDSARLMNRFALSLPGEEPHVSTFDVPIGGIGRDRNDSLRCVVFHPNTTAKDVGDLRCVAIWLHGGGWVVGSVFESSNRAKVLAKASDMIVVALQYRLSPDYVFPCQLKDIQVRSCISNMPACLIFSYYLIYVCHYYLLSVVCGSFDGMLQNGVEIQNALPWWESQQGPLSL